MDPDGWINCLVFLNAVEHIVDDIDGGCDTLLVSGEEFFNRWQPFVREQRGGSRRCYLSCRLGHSSEEVGAAANEAEKTILATYYVERGRDLLRIEPLSAIVEHTALVSSVIAFA